MQLFWAFLSQLECASQAGTLPTDFNRYFGEKDIPECEYACDWHKDAARLKRAKQNGLQSEEWVSTQREMGRYDSGYDGYD